MKAKNIHVVPHMHWDREWYFSTEESQVLLVNNMEEIIERLENDPDYPAYVLDGQTAVLEDYFAAKPENHDRVQKLVKAGRLKVGPWYTQTDEAIIGGESIVRNLLYGMKDSKQLGTPMMIGYVPDSFGQSAQAPMILNQFGINRSLFWRGFTKRKGTNSSEFIWQSKDGSKVTAENFVLGYAIGKYLETDPVALKKRMDGILAEFDARANGDVELLPNGHDQMPIQQNIHEVITLLNQLYPERHFSLSSYEDLFDQIEKQKLPIVEGEMLDGQHGRIHRSIYSVRMDLKVYNTQLENKITNILEPLMAIAKHLGIPYQHGLVELIWKELMKNHAHDSIGGCVSDKVNREILGRYLVAEERVNSLIDFYKRRITEATETGSTRDKLTIFNLLPEREDGRVTASIVTKADGFELYDSNEEQVPFAVLSRNKLDAGLVDRQIVAHGDYEPFNEFLIELDYPQKGFGYQTLTIKPISRTSEAYGHRVKAIETDAYHIEILPNGTLTIDDKQSGKHYTNVLNVENQGNDGDEYDFSPLRTDVPLYSADLVDDAETKIVEYRDSFKAEICYVLNLPKDLGNRLVQKPQTAPMKFAFTIEVSKHSRTIKVNVNIDNRVKDARTRVLFPTGIKSQKVYSDNQFGTITRPVHDDAAEVWEEEKWDERPDAIFPFLSYVSLSEDQTASILTDSSREYEVVGEDDTIALTLLSSVEWLGKADLVRRPGRPSGIHAITPDAEVLGEISLDFALRLDDKPFEKANVAQAAKEYLTPFVAYNQIPFVSMHLNPVGVQSASDLSLSLPVPDEAVITTIKAAEDDTALLVRIYNPTDRPLPLVEGVKQLNLDETEREPQSDILPSQVLTLVAEQWQ